MRVAWLTFSSADYDEEADGFMFKRVKNKPAPTTSEKTRSAPPPQDGASNVPQPKALGDDMAEKPNVRRKKMTFSTPKPENEVPRRRSKRLSKDNEQAERSPIRKQSQKKDTARLSDPPTQLPPKASPKKPPKELAKRKAEHSHSDPAHPDDQTKIVPTSLENHSATRIALPVADTPVIKRNKAMREGKSGKGERRSSLGNRGRRASSLIESGTSNGERGHPLLIRNSSLTSDLKLCPILKWTWPIITSILRAMVCPSLDG